MKLQERELAEFKLYKKTQQDIDKDNKHYESLKQ